MASLSIRWLVLADNGADGRRHDGRPRELILLPPERV
jgi:hypothetical protein